MTDEEFRAIIAAGPAVVMVESRHMIALLDERDGLRAENARLREALENSAIMIQGCYDAPTNPDSLPQMLLHYIRAALEVKP